MSALCVAMLATAPPKERARFAFDSRSLSSISSPGKYVGHNFSEYYTARNSAGVRSA
jgi:hypothetical protein